MKEKRVAAGRGWIVSWDDVGHIGEPARWRRRAGVRRFYSTRVAVARGVAGSCWDRIGALARASSRRLREPATSPPAARAGCEAPGCAATPPTRVPSARMKGQECRTTAVAPTAAVEKYSFLLPYLRGKARAAISTDSSSCSSAYGHAGCAGAEGAGCSGIRVLALAILSGVAAASPLGDAHARCLMPRAAGPWL